MRPSHVMKKRLILLVLMSGWLSPAHAELFDLIGCEFKYVQKYNTSKYVGLYKSMQGNFITLYFDSYCPSSVNR